MFTPEMMESVKKVEATRASRLGMEPRRMTAEEKDQLLREFHPDYRAEAFEEIKVGPNKGQKANKELVHMLHSNSRLLKDHVDLSKIDYDVDVLVIGGGDGACSNVGAGVAACGDTASNARAEATSNTSCAHVTDRPAHCSVPTATYSSPGSSSAGLSPGF